VEAPVYPLGLAYIGSQVYQDHQVNILDLNVIDDPYNELKNCIEKNDPEMVGVSFRNIKLADPSGKYLSCVETLEKVLKFIKKVKSDVKISVGGPAFSLYAAHIMERVSEIDFGIFSEGEESFPELLNHLDQPDKVKGLFFRNGNKVNFTGYRKWTPFETSPRPRRDLIEIQRYFDKPYAVGVQTKRGCILECIHCCDRYLLGNSLRLRSPEAIVAEIEDLVINHNTKSIHFVDQIFNIPLKHAQEICEEIIKRKISVAWTAWFNERYITEDFLHTAKEAGCNLINFSPDSTSDVVLKRLKKNISRKDINNAVQVVKKSQLPVAFSFMINGPGENLKTLLSTIAFILKTKLILKDRLKVHTSFMIPMRIYPHTELRDIAVERKLIKKDDDLIEPSHFNPLPLKYIVIFIGKFTITLWWGKHIIKTAINKINSIFRKR